MRDLDAGRPAAIVVEHRDVFPMVTGDAIDSADTLNDFRDSRLMQKYTLNTSRGPRRLPGDPAPG